MWLLIANVVIHFIHVVWNRHTPRLPADIFGLSMNGLKSGYLWQPVTYMFFHDPVGMMHLLMNMIGLYFLGTEFERAFGQKRFLQFYGLCGIVGGIAYLVLSLFAMKSYAYTPLIGASGAIYGLLVAAIIFFPHINIILIVFPVPIRVFGLIIAAILLLQLLAGNVPNAGGEVCHVAGAATGVVIFWAWGFLPKVQLGSGKVGQFVERQRQGSWSRKQKQLAIEQVEVDRILAKVHEQGIPSLSRRERKLLEKATRRKQEQDRSLGRTDRL